MFRCLRKLFSGGNKRSGVEEGVSGKIDYGKLADRSDARAKALNIDPPRPGRKTYSERYSEAIAMSPGERRALIARREAEGKQCGVLYRAEADSGG